MADMIEIKHLNKYFGDLHVLKDINLTVKRRREARNDRAFRLG